MDVTFYAKKHIDILKDIESENIQKYFGENQIFHDSTVYRWKYKPKTCCLEYFLKIWVGRKVYFKIKLTFREIFEIKFINSVRVDPEYYERLSWDNYFHCGNSFNFLYCYFDISDYEKMSRQNLKKPAFKARLFFDNCYDVELDFTQLDVEGPEKRIDNFITHKLYRTD